LFVATYEANIKEIPLDRDVVIQSRSIQLPHQDPADRFIAATARVHDLMLITSDKKLIQSKEIQLIKN